MMYRFGDLQRALGYESFRVKDESLNPTGTFKDRRSAAIVAHAIEQKADALALISAGNAAYSLSKYAAEAGIPVRSVVSHTLTPGIRSVLRRVCQKVVEVDLDQKPLAGDDLTALVRESPDEHILDVTNGFHGAYESIVVELRRDLQKPPDAIIMPFGGGEAMLGVMDGVHRVGWGEKTAVYGIRKKSAERLKTSFFHRDHVRCFSHMRGDVRHAVFELVGDYPDDVLHQPLVPAPVRAEEAASYVFQYAITRHEDLVNRGERNIVLINSGYGHVLHEAGRVHRDDL